MVISIGIAAAMGCAAAAWWITQIYERSKNTARVREMESKIRHAQGEAFQLREQLSLLKG